MYSIHWKDDGQSGSIHFWGARGDSLGITKERRGMLEWYSLIDRGARDSVCERNSKESPRDGGGGCECMVGRRERERRREEYSGVEAQSQKIALRARWLVYLLGLILSHSPPLTPQVLFHL